ncbi:DUF3006 domain-containing protein [Pelosinus fermentans]|uniref:DUF3006 domain-containing protein n=1 Tax=Pelosinus fermentans JBW45 TaxID=1192197 RepID=I8TTX7_9FIRM|nr:DUF3006 domain-containing protein [Pelosinus fermentans]AJQ28356.1 Protein of unknown function DUF3006 [Pelosinus fermentans JBW45]
MKVLAVIDRFEGDKAVLLLDDEEVQVVWPRESLPSEAQEGDVITMELQVDHEATIAAKAEAERLLKEIMERNQEG